MQQVGDFAETLNLGFVKEALKRQAKDDFKERIIEGRDITKKLRIMNINIGPHGSDYGIRHVSISARSYRNDHNIFPHEPSLSKFILSRQAYDALGIDLNELASSDSNCVAGIKSHYLEVKLTPKIPGRTGYVRDEPDWDYHSFPGDLRIVKLSAVRAEFVTWGNPEMHGDNSHNDVRLFVNGNESTFLYTSPNNYKFKLSLEVKRSDEEDQR